MRELQARLGDLQVVVHEQVEVNRARPEALAAHAPETRFDREQALQELPRG